MVDGADGTIGGNDEGDDEEGDGHDGEGFAPAQPDGDDATCELPCCGVESVGDPVRYGQSVIQVTKNESVGSHRQNLMDPIVDDGEGQDRDRGWSSGNFPLRKPTWAG